MVKSTARALAVIGAALAAFVLMQVMALPAYASSAVLAIDTAGRGSNVTIDCATGDNLAEAIENGYLKTLDQDADESYSFKGEKLCAIAAKPASAYTDEEELDFDSVYANGWLDTYNWGEVEGNRTFYAIWEGDFGSDPAGLHHHVWKYSDFSNLAIKKATFTKGGYAYNECALCGRQSYAMPWPRVDTCRLLATSFAYTGKVQKPKVTVSSADGPLANENYFVTYSNNTNVGTATAKVVLKGKYYEGAKTLTFKITKAANSAKPAKLTVKKAFKKAKVKKKAQKVTLPKVKTKFGKAAWKVTAKDKKGKLKLKSSKVVVKKGTKKGKYTISLKASVKGTANYKAATSKAVKVTVTVK